MQIGDIVARKSYGKDITFKIVDIKSKDDQEIYYLKGINLRIIADSPRNDLEIVSLKNGGDKEVALNRKVNASIRKIMISRWELKRMGVKKSFRNELERPKGELYFGRPGRILHIDGDSEYLETCLRVYKELSLQVVGEVVPEQEQPKVVVDLVKENRPDIVIITGHDSILKGTTDFMDIENYKNSKYYVQSVTELRNYRSDYDDLVIYAGACQSCYEALLDAGANYTKLRLLYSSILNYFELNINSY